ncbi:DUF3192 domain-containing protein [Paraferrimonas sp. SM1919]|uniref:DUF3192 domain-containing protein n=1 Tax=Paraferrimonas sp. SM1919 TaxID=2662263 RepID=UPI0013D08B47|nr:DUF3192 domain-containing protein [Paraferrimonas sp. SM1919]
MKTHSPKIVTLFLATALLSGCVVHVGGDKYHESNDWKVQQAENLANLSQLKVGMTTEQVQALMGAPDLNEIFNNGEQSVQVWFYRTQHKHGDGETTKDECTPVVLVDNVLTGFGETAYHRVRNH